MHCANFPAHEVQCLLDFCIFCGTASARNHLRFEFEVLTPSITGVKCIRLSYLQYCSTKSTGRQEVTASKMQLFSFVVVAILCVSAVCGAPVFTQPTPPSGSFQEYARLNEQRNMLLNAVEEKKATIRGNPMQQHIENSLAQRSLQALQRKLSFVSNQVSAFQRHARNLNPAVGEARMQSLSQQSHPAVNSNQKYFYIVKSPRSGSTLLMKLLSSDPRVSMLW